MPTLSDKKCVFFLVFRCSVADSRGEEPTYSWPESSGVVGIE